MVHQNVDSYVVVRVICKTTRLIVNYHTNLAYNQISNFDIFSSLFRRLSSMGK